MSLVVRNTGLICLVRLGSGTSRGALYTRSWNLHVVLEVVKQADDRPGQF